jgi:Ser/Thr protein kinase RdoA (MazF antagonist)
MSPSQFVKYQSLARVVESFCGSKPSRVRALERDSEGFSGAIVLRVTVTDSLTRRDVEYCLRGWPPKSLVRDRLLGLHRLLAHVHQAGVTQVAVPLRSRFGTTLFTEAGQFWQLEPWMPGTASFWTDANDVRLRNALITLARWHEAAAGFVPRPAEAAWFQTQTTAISPTVTDRLQRIDRFVTSDVRKLRSLIASATELPNWGASFGELVAVATRMLELFDRAASSVAAELNVFRDQPVRLQPCLRDVWHDHVLFERDEVTGLIDPNAARSESVATDVARLLGSFLNDDTDRWGTAIEAYRTVRPFSDREWQLARVIDRSTVLLSGLTWLERLFVQRLASVNTVRVLDRLRQVLTRLERLADGPTAPTL